MTQLSVVFSFLLALFTTISGLDNGLALKPPMGWLSWQRFRCNTNCTKDPNDCISQQLYMDMADKMVEDGWRDLGYIYVNIDDCWSAMERDNVTGEVVPDPERFPDGIDGLANYMHNRSLKLGLYSAIGNYTCSGYPGMAGHFELDCNTFANWGIDSLKVDGCQTDVTQFYKTYPELEYYLNATGRPIVYSCSWPAYIEGHGEAVPIIDNTTLYEIAKYCNLWRNYKDIQDSWDSILYTQNWWERNYNNYSNDEMLSVAGPGQWNDPDQLVIGDNGLSIFEAMTQMSLWAIFAAPLLMSNDLRIISNEMKNILQNREVIAINQDSMGKQGGFIWRNSDTNPTLIVWIRELEDSKSICIVLQNAGYQGSGNFISFETQFVPSFVSNGAWSGNTVQFYVRDLWKQQDLGMFTNVFTTKITPSSVGMYKMTLK